MLSANFKQKQQLRHRAVPLRQHGILVSSVKTSDIVKFCFKSLTQNTLYVHCSLLRLLILRHLAMIIIVTDAHDSYSVYSPQFYQYTRDRNVTWLTSQTVNVSDKCAHIYETTLRSINFSVNWFRV